MSFLDQAKEVLDEAKVTRLELLARKSADLETTSEEDSELFTLKDEVKKAIASRDRAKNLSFLKHAGYSIKEILEEMGADHQAVIKDSGLTISDILKLLQVTKKEAQTALKQVYQSGNATSTTTATFDGVLAIYGTKELKLTDRMKAEFSNEIKAGGIATFVANLTAEGKEWLLQSRKKERGTGEIYDNVNKMKTKFGFDNKQLLEALKKADEPKEEVKAPKGKKQEEKAPA